MWLCRVSLDYPWAPQGSCFPLWPLRLAARRFLWRDAWLCVIDSLAIVPFSNTLPKF